MFWINKKIKRPKQVIIPLMTSIQPNVVNPHINSQTWLSYSYASSSTMTIEGIWDMEREMKRAERKNKIEELFPDLKSSLDVKNEKVEIKADD